MRLSFNITLLQLTRSQTARQRKIDNRPPINIIRNLRSLANTLEKVQRILRHPIGISSGYRSPLLNQAIGGSKTSKHVAGLAADFTCRRFGTPYTICRAIADSRLDFDQLIYEYGNTAGGGWVHLGLGRKNRRQILTICQGDHHYHRGLRRCARTER